VYVYLTAEKLDNVLNVANPKTNNNIINGFTPYMSTKAFDERPRSKCTKVVFLLVYF